ncbi:Oidioi.mRNA.OKI2018_I69.PAR.g9989.t1.cds [Oikopleura dioica]|uniref:Oidioi.mRNA.OKI2018_I69.PAR.g9989.t1.cds n=1 Tax=Oikopleura dioica TaxID=34765 RepID=A0ABN7RSL6_OIKDI|nr:Oidioi.mRNA.OKI2018_I69.PAR.g9989.t1.cds [Oikopleura dioica]
MRLFFLVLSLDAFKVNTRNNNLDQWASTAASQGWDPSLNGDISRLLSDAGIARNLKKFTNMKFSKRSPSFEDGYY